MRIQGFSLQDVELTDAVLENAFIKEQAYLRSIDVDRLLAGFVKTAGREKKADCYTGGWEDTEIAGHTLGHYLTALAQLYAATGAKDIEERLTYMLLQLAECQREDGFLFASGDELFDKVERGEQVWVPWYTMHKVVSGLLSVYQLTAMPLALDIVTRLGEWIARRTQGWSTEVHDRVLQMEYGGMNDCLYELYHETGRQEFLRAAASFDETPLFDAIRSGKDVLPGKHANTTIPKFLGAVNRYIVLGETEEEYLQAARSFFDIVTRNHTYITGGNSEWEHFRASGTLGKERTCCNCETCNSYNMLKLAERLYAITGEKSYMDFYERTFLNAILGSQNPETGMTTYFQPMAAGYFKTFSRPTDNFWCCTGTGMENFTKLGSQIYHRDEKGIIVDLFLGSILHDRKLNVDLIQKTDLDRFDSITMTVTSEENKRFTLGMRIPEWTNQRFEVKVNGLKADFSVREGYLYLDREWRGTEQVSVKFSPEIVIHPLPDMPNSAAVTYGPFALAAGLGYDDMQTDITGVNVTVPTKKLYIRDKIMVKGQSVKEWFLECASHFVKPLNEVAFTLSGTDADEELTFTPYYKHYADRFALYFDYYAESKNAPSEVEQKINELHAQLKAVTPEAAKVDNVPISETLDAKGQGTKKPKTKKAMAILIGGHVLGAFVLFLLCYVFFSPAFGVRKGIDAFVSKSFPGMTKLLALKEVGEVESAVPNTPMPRIRKRFLDNPEASIKGWTLKEGFHAFVTLLDDMEYIGVEGDGITVLYPNEEQARERQQVLVTKGTARAGYFWDYDLKKPESLCPLYGSYNPEGLPQYLFAFDGMEGDLHILHGEELYEQRIVALDRALTEFADINAYNEGTDTVLIDATIGTVPYLFSIPKLSGTFRESDYAVSTKEGFVYTPDSEGIRVDAYVTFAGAYVGKLVGKLILQNEVYTLKTFGFSAFATGKFGDIDGGGIIHGVTLAEAMRERVSITGDKGERLLIDIRDDVEHIPYAKDGFVKSDTNVYTYQVDGKTVSLKGVDVSKYQESIDWKKVKADGVEFAIIRIGFRGMGTNGTCELDPYFKQNMEGAAAASIPVGVYFFTQATTVQEAKEEAQFVIEHLKGYDVTWPVIFDTEEITSYEKARANKLSNALRTDLAITFLEEIKKAGYTPMLYANTRWSILNLELWRLKDYDFWYAYYGDNIYYPYNFAMWQYSSTGTVDGIKGNADMNISFIDYGAKSRQ